MPAGSGSGQFGHSAPSLWPEFCSLPSGTYATEMPTIGRSLATTRKLLVNHSGNSPETQTAAKMRLEDAARICGRIGHDFDNVLMGLMGFSELLQAELETGSRAARYVAELLAVAEGAREITRQLHTFNRTGRPIPTPTRLTDVCVPGNSSRLDAPAGVRVEVVLPADLPRVGVGQ